jgi:tRNA (guanosine-2'-O-)-methyltransferase
VPGVELTLHQLPVDQPVAFLFGNEHAGLTARARALADLEFAIPLDGFSESVNLSVAAALTLFTHAERRRAQLGTRGDLPPGARQALRARYYSLSVRGADSVIRRAYGPRDC